jgi:hypothetical protein
MAGVGWVTGAVVGVVVAGGVTGAAGGGVVAAGAVGVGAAVCAVDAGSGAVAAGADVEGVTLGVDKGGSQSENNVKGDRASVAVSVEDCPGVFEADADSWFHVAPIPMAKRITNVEMRGIL